MAISEIDIYRTAKIIVDGCGEDAVILASIKADKFLAIGDLDGHRVWLRVKKAMEELLSNVIPECARMN